MHRDIDLSLKLWYLRIREYSMKEENTESLKKVAERAIGLENALRDKLRSLVNSAFEDNATTSVCVMPRGNRIDFEIKGCWYLPESLRK
jgi:hypothetical protein